MLKEKHSLLYLNINKTNSLLYDIINKIYKSLYSLFDLILEDPFENILYECINIILGYLQLIIYILDRTVSQFFIIFIM